MLRNLSTYVHGGGRAVAHQGSAARRSWLSTRARLLPSRTWLGLAVVACLAVAGLPQQAEAALSRTVSVTINEVNCGSACDGQGIEGPADGPPDWFARVFMNGQPADPAEQHGPDDTAKLQPDWVFRTVVPATQATVDVRIQIWDEDSFSDDLADATPQVGDKNLDFTIDAVKNTVTGEISGGIGSKLCTFGNGDDGDGSATVCFTAGTGDRDGDGLQDTWETNGIDFDGNGTIDLALQSPPFNANPDRKDIFAEVDFMACSAGGCAAGDGHSHAPQPGALQDVVNAFAAAPVVNPGGSRGITLHAMQDQALAERSQVLFKTDGPDPDDDFNDIKNGNPAGPCTGSFGTSAERADPNCANVLAARRGVFQYVMFGHAFSEAPNSSGISELDPKGGNDLMVTLGNWSAGSLAANGGRRPSEAGTFMHELGHNLGLRHGGFEDENCKPNYLSVMSYALQFTNIDNTRPLDYSTSVLPALNETALPGTGGVGGPAGRNTVFGRAGGSIVAPANGPIDWDGKGGTTGDVDVITAIKPGCNVPSPGDTDMRGFDDWSNLVYDFRSSPMFADGAFRTTPEELTSETVVAMTPVADLNATKTVDKTSAQPGDTLAYTVTAANAGPGKAVGVKISDTLPDGTVQDRSVGGLVVGASSAQSFTYAVPCSALNGSTVTNAAKVTGTNAALVADAKLADNSASASTTVQAPVVGLASSAAPTVHAGEAITYQLTATNTGSASATDVVVTDTLPAEVYYSTALDLGTGPQPGTVERNVNGSTTLTWHLGTVAAGAAVTIGYTARPSLLLVAGDTVREDASASFGNANGCTYAPATASATPDLKPEQLNEWRRSSGPLTSELLARVQATDQRNDGADGSVPDGRLSAVEAQAALATPGQSPSPAAREQLESPDQVGFAQPRGLRQQLLTSYLNMGARHYNAEVVLRSRTAERLGLRTVEDAARYAQATLSVPLTQATKGRYDDITRLLQGLNNAAQLRKDIAG